MNVSHHKLVEQSIFSIISMKSVIWTRKCRHPVNSCLNTKATARWHYQCEKNQTQLSRVFRTKHYRHPQWNSLHRVSCSICHYQDFRQAVLCLLLFPFLFFVSLCWSKIALLAEFLLQTIWSVDTFCLHQLQCLKFGNVNLRGWFIRWAIKRFIFCKEEIFWSLFV